MESPPASGGNPCQRNSGTDCLLMQEGLWDVANPPQLIAMKTATYWYVFLYLAPQGDYLYYEHHPVQGTLAQAISLDRAYFAYLDPTGAPRGAPIPSLAFLPPASPAATSRLRCPALPAKVPGRASLRPKRIIRCSPWLPAVESGQHEQSPH